MSSPPGDVRPPVRIVFIINSLSGGGAERALMTLLEYFSHNPEVVSGAQLSLVLLDGADDKHLPPRGFSVHRLNGRGGWVESVRSLRRILVRLKPDACISFLARANCANILAAKSLRYACVISERVNTTSHFGDGLVGLLSRLLIRSLYPRADLVIANSIGIREDLSSNYQVDPRRISVVSNPFDLDALHVLANAAPEIALPRRYAIAVGRLTRNKNFPLLISAFADSCAELDLVVLGEGEEREALAREARHAGLASRFHMPGFVGNPYPLIKGAQFFVSSSNAEGFPNAIAEAMALGTPVVATDCPSGPSELLEGSAPPGTGVCMASCGILVPIEDRASLAKGIRQIRDAEIASVYRCAARQRMEAFRVEVVAAQYAAAFRSVILR